MLFSSLVNSYYYFCFIVQLLSIIIIIIITVITIDHLYDGSDVQTSLNLNNLWSSSMVNCL